MRQRQREINASRRRKRRRERKDRVFVSVYKGHVTKHFHTKGNCRQLARTPKGAVRVRSREVLLGVGNPTIKPCGTCAFLRATAIRR